MIIHVLILFYQSPTLQAETNISAFVDIVPFQTAQTVSDTTARDLGQLEF